MQLRHATAAVLPLALITLLAGCGSDDAVNETSAAPQPLNCSEITAQRLGIAGLGDVAAVEVAASGASGAANSTPAHCRVTAKLNQRTGADGLPYAIGVELRLPAAWNGRFLYAGDGGLDGVIGDPTGTTGLPRGSSALSRGFAVAASDGGHQAAAGNGFDAAFGADPQARLDYGYNALGTWAPLAKGLLQTFYGVPAARSYYAGCSKGGQSGLQAAARLADVFDGIVAGNPGFNLPKAALATVYDNQRFATVNADIAQAFSRADLDLVATSIRSKCDALDGAQDGMVSDVAACQQSFDFDADVPQCAAGSGPDGSCLSAVQKTALKAVMGGAKTSTGTALYASWPWDPGIAGAGWTTWKTFLNLTLGPVATANVFSTPPTPGVVAFSPAATAFWQQFDLDRGFEVIYGTGSIFPFSAMDFMLPPNMTQLPTLKARAKLLVYHGTADPIFSSNDTRDWYDGLVRHDARAADYARLFLVPGMNHCGGGPATDDFDALSAVVDWVEQGTAPQRIVAKVAAANADRPSSWSAARSRPLCPYPQKAVLKTGATDLEAADSFVCQ
jgi:feruloyl esterase